MTRFKVLAALVALAAPAGPTACAEQPHPFAGHRQVTVMTQNLYLGTDLNPIFTAANQFALFAAVGSRWAQVQANDFPARAEAIADCGPPTTPASSRRCACPDDLSRSRRSGAGVSRRS